MGPSADRGDGEYPERGAYRAPKVAPRGAPWPRTGMVPETPVRMQYHLTEKGRALASVVNALSAGAQDWQRELPGAGNCRERATHAACASPPATSPEPSATR